jgi:hypothetical protein
MSAHIRLCLFTWCALPMWLMRWGAKQRVLVAALCCEAAQVSHCTLAHMHSLLGLASYVH